MRHTTDAVHTLRSLIVWWLALVVPLQAMAVGVMQTRGPAHWHATVQPAVGDTLLLAADLRRQVGRAAVDPSRQRRIDDAHAHAHATAQQHHHAFDDASVQYVDGERFAGSSHDDGTAADGLGWFAPLPPFVSHWSGAGPTDTRDPRALWTPTASIRVRLDRPPRHRAG